MDLLKETHRIWAMHREFRTALRELGSYTDRELTELGLERGDIARIAYEEAERRIGTRDIARRRPRRLARARSGRLALGWHDPAPITSSHGGAHDDAPQRQRRGARAARHLARSTAPNSSSWRGNCAPRRSTACFWPRATASPGCGVPPCRAPATNCRAATGAELPEQAAYRTRKD